MEENQQELLEETWLESLISADKDAREGLQEIVLGNSELQEHALKSYRLEHRREEKAKKCKICWGKKWISFTKSSRYPVVFQGTTSEGLKLYSSMPEKMTCSCQN